MTEQEKNPSKHRFVLSGHGQEFAEIRKNIANISNRLREIKQKIENGIATPDELAEQTKLVQEQNELQLRLKQPPSPF